MEYATQLYEAPAHLGYERICRDRLTFSREHVALAQGGCRKVALT